MSKWLKYLFSVVIICFFVFLIFIWQWLSFLHAPMINANQQPIQYVYSKHTPVKALAQDLHKKGLLAKPLFFILLAHITGNTRNLQAGQYQLTPGITPAQLLQKIVTGKVVLHAFTIVPGWIFKQVIVQLERNKYLSHSLKGANNDQIMQKLGYPGEIPEGRFLPNTYKFGAYTADTDILIAAYNLMQNELSRAWAGRDKSLPYSCKYKTLIVASIIEKEAGIKSERPVIAGIIAKRLKNNMYLQMDPTLIYGLGDAFKGKLTNDDLKLNTAYNTYLNKGLPPTPICMPSANAILSALHPTKTSYLYFVAKGDGSHDFSATLTDHNAAINKYLLNNIKYKKRIKKHVK
ncbi:MAG: endolytic transglycosylase MltG [Gammaproteobacteria bacterium]|nr:endolytic transglycosylase MltG [Gammaproteobacteria bacterium]